MALSAKNNANMVIMVTGYSGSGKSELSSMLREEFGGQVISVGQEMRSVARDKGFGGLSEFINEAGAMKCFDIARPHIVGRIGELYRLGSIIVDGLYECKLAELVRNCFGSHNSAIVNVFADRSRRIERVTARTGGDIAKGINEVERRDSVKLMVGVNEVIDKSDFTVDNNTDVKGDLRLKIRHVAQCVLNDK